MKREFFLVTDPVSDRSFLLSLLFLLKKDFYIFFVYNTDGEIIDGLIMFKMEVFQC